MLPIWIYTELHFSGNILVSTSQRPPIGPTRQEFLLAFWTFLALLTNEPSTWHGITFSVRIFPKICQIYFENTIFTFSKIAASVGGVFGFCLCASIISFIEVIYFVVVRVCGRMLSYLWMPNRSYKRNKQLPIGTYEKPAKHINRIHAGWTIRRLVNLSFLWRKFRRS